MRIEDILAMEESQTFDRNSHIAEYLKDYKYVKDFGEGVDRMCREMGAQGLPKPEYKQDSFILKAIIRNSGYVLKKADFASEKVDFNPKKSDFSPKKVDFDLQKLNFEKIVDAVIVSWNTVVECDFHPAEK